MHREKEIKCWWASLGPEPCVRQQDVERLGVDRSTSLHVALRKLGYTCYYIAEAGWIVPTTPWACGTRLLLSMPNSTDRAVSSYPKSQITSQTVLSRLVPYPSNDPSMPSSAGNAGTPLVLWQGSFSWSGFFFFPFNIYLPTDLFPIFEMSITIWPSYAPPLRLDWWKWEFAG